MTIVIAARDVTKQFQLGQTRGLTQTISDGFRRLRGAPARRRTAFKALEDVNFSVRQGEVLGIIGHNGAGKSTLLKLLAGISKPTHGSLQVSGRVAPLIEVGAGMVPDMTGRENIYLNASIMGMTKAEIRRKFDEIVDFSELEKFIDTPVKRYSSGMQIKLGFAIATSVESEILIVDEVLAVGDLAFQRKCFERMETLIKRQERTVLLVSHNIRQVERICNRVILLDHGKIAADGEPKSVCGLFYDHSDEKIATQSKINVANVSDQLELLSVTLSNLSGEAVEKVYSGDDVLFEFLFEVKHVISRPNFGFGIHTTDLLYLATEITEERFRAMKLMPGKLKIQVKLPRLPFLPGVYLVRIGVDAGEVPGTIFYAESVINFIVQSREIGRSQSSTEGFVPLHVDWQLENDANDVSPKTAQTFA